MGSRQSNHNKLLMVILSVALVFLMGFSIWLALRPSGPNPFAFNTDDDLLDDAIANSSTEIGPRVDEQPQPGDEVIGGVERPTTDLQQAKAQEDDTSFEEEVAQWFDVGETPGVPLDANEQVEAVAEAVRTGRYPERLSVAATSETTRTFDSRKFDPESDVHDPAYRDAYLRSPEPGRVWHPAAPGPGVQRIQPLMPTFVKVNQNEDITLRVSGVPGQPVTFTSFDLGMFENQLTTTTIVANDQGVAEAKFRGPPGTFDDVQVMAASPVMSGQVRLTVHVIAPNIPLTDGTASR